MRGPYVERGVDGLLTRVNAEPAEVIYVSGKQTQWLDYLPSPILALTATPTFCAVATQDGTLTVYSHTGRRCAFQDVSGRTS